MFLIAKIVRGRRLLHELEKQAEKEKARERDREREREKERTAAEKANNSEWDDTNEAQPTGDTGSESPMAGASTSARAERLRNRDNWKRQFSLAAAVKEIELDENSLEAPVASTSATAADGVRGRRRTWVPELHQGIEQPPSKPSPSRFHSSRPAVQRRPSMSIVTTPLLAVARSFRVKRWTASRSSSGERRLSISRAEVSQLRRQYVVGSGGSAGLTASLRAARQDADGYPIRESTDGLLDLPERTNGRRSNTGGIRRTSSMPSVTLDITGERLRHYNYDIKLNRLQKRALRFTWHRLQTRNGGKKVEQVFEDVYDRLLKSIPICSQMFATRIFISAMSKVEALATLRDHARLTVKMFDVIIRNLDCEGRKRMDTGSEFDPLRIGRAHISLRPYGFVSAFWEKLGETIIDVVLGQEAVRDLPGASQAWVVLTACVVDQLRAGFENVRNLTQQRAPAAATPSSKKPSTATNASAQQAASKASTRASAQEQQHQQQRPFPSLERDRRGPSRSSSKDSQKQLCSATDGEGGDNDDSASSRKNSYTHPKCSSHWSAPPTTPLARLATQESWSSSRHSSSRRSTPENLPIYAEGSK